MSQQVSYNEDILIIETSGSPLVEPPISQLIQIVRSRDVKRALNVTAPQPMDELVFALKGGLEKRISLRHSKIADLIDLLNFIHRKTNLAVPSLEDLK